MMDGLSLSLGLGARNRGAAALLQETYGALSRAQPGAGIATTATAIVSGDPSGHWQIGSGRLYPSTAGDTANMNAGPYTLELDNGQVLNITIEADTWDVATQAEWDVIAFQSAGTLAGRKIALRNSTMIDTKVTGLTGSPLRRVELRASGVPLTIEGRFGAVGDWASYCEVNRFSFVGVRGVTVRHLRFEPSAASKIGIRGETANNCDDTIIEDCWVRGAEGDPFGDYSVSTSYPMRNIDLISTGGSNSVSVGNITVRNCFVEWAANCINLGFAASGKSFVVEGNEVRYFYNDGIKISYSNGLPSLTIRGNTVYAPMGRPSDSDAQHPDAMQVTGSPTAIADWTNILIEENVIFPGASRGVQQAIFLDDMKTGAGDSGFFFTATVRNNLISNNVAQGIWVLQAKNCVIDNNTAVCWNLAATVSTTSIFVGASSTNATNGGGNTVTDNIAESFSIASGSTQSNNIATGQNGTTIALSTLFAGPTFGPTTRAEAIALFATLPAANGAGAVFP